MLKKRVVTFLVVNGFIFIALNQSDEPATYGRQADEQRYTMWSK